VPIHNLDDPTPEDLDAIRDILSHTMPVERMTDEQLVEEMKLRLEKVVPAPPVRAGAGPVNARVWLHDAVTAGGFKEPEDPDSEPMADLKDGGELIPLGALGMLVMRHTSDTDAANWTDERFAREFRLPIEHFQRGQKLLDEVAALVGRPATPYARWWERS
jgi:hypothetical protein